MLAWGRAVGTEAGRQPSERRRAGVASSRSCGAEEAQQPQLSLSSAADPGKASGRRVLCHPVSVKVPCLQCRGGGGAQVPARPTLQGGLRRWVEVPAARRVCVCCHVATPQQALSEAGLSPCSTYSDVARLLLLLVICPTNTPPLDFLSQCVPHHPPVADSG